MKPIKAILTSVCLMLTCSACVGCGAAHADPGEKTSSFQSDPHSSETAQNEETDTSGGHARLLYMGHASLRITTAENRVIYIDPYAGNGYEPAADMILVTHDHFDHTALDKISRRAPDCRTVTWKEALVKGGYQTFDFGFASVEAVEAGYNRHHSVKSCVGYIITLSDGVKVYVSGDTSQTRQMSRLSQKNIDYAFYCCDGVYNMDLKEAAACAKLVSAKHDIPYHVIAAKGSVVFDRKMAEKFDSPNLLVIEDGEEISLLPAVR